MIVLLKFPMFTTDIGPEPALRRSEPVLALFLTSDCSNSRNRPVFRTRWSTIHTAVDKNFWATSARLSLRVKLYLLKLRHFHTENCRLTHTIFVSARFKVLVSHFMTCCLMTISPILRAFLVKFRYFRGDCPVVKLTQFDTVPAPITARLESTWIRVVPSTLRKFSVHKPKVSYLSHIQTEIHIVIK